MNLFLVVGFDRKMSEEPAQRNFHGPLALLGNMWNEERN